MEMASARMASHALSSFRQRTIRSIFVSYAAVSSLFVSDQGLMLVLAMYFWLISCGYLIEEIRNTSLFS